MDIKSDQEGTIHQMTLAAARFIFDNKTPNILLLDSYVVRDKGAQIRSYKVHKMDPSDGSGFA